MSSGPSKDDTFSSDLCGKCQGIFQGWSGIEELRESPRTFAHHGSETALKLSAQDGCSLCSQFLLGYTAAESWEDGDWPGVQGAGVVTPRPLPRSRTETKICLPLELFIPQQAQTAGNSAADADSLVGEVYSVELYQTALSGIAPPTDVDRILRKLMYDYSPALNNPAADSAASTVDALPLCKEWLRKCMESHKMCGLSSAAVNPNHLNPTRLLSIGGEVPRLYLTAGLRTRVSYASLSHCWGLLKFTTLTKGNLTEFTDRIPQDALTKTFRDAIYTAKHLGFEYLWIDSLCIVQDDPSDWEREAVLMRSVYAGAELNIAATSAVDGTGGCFFPRDKTWRCRILVGSGDSRTAFEAISYASRHPEDLPLNSRAWVVQERYLSRRILHFHKSQVFWECQENPACEAFPSGYPVRPTAQLWRSFTTFEKQKRPITLAQWNGIVGEYSACALTRLSDKPVAISGLAEFMHTETKDEYVVGLWRRNLEQALCWHNPWGDRISPPTAPSWSWASVHGGRSTFLGSPWRDDGYEPRGGAEYLIAVHDVQVEHNTSSPFGPPKHSKLRLRCDFLFPGMFISAGGEKTWAFQINNGSGEKLSYKVDPTFDSIPVRERTAVEAFVVPISVLKNFEVSFALVLGPKSGNRGQYERIGWCRVVGLSRLKAQEFMRQAHLVRESDFAGILVDKDGSVCYFIDLV